MTLFNLGQRRTAGSLSESVLPLQFAELPVATKPVIARFADAGEEFQCQLSEGEDAVYVLPGTLAECPAALDLSACISKASALDAQRSDEMLQHLHDLRAQLGVACYVLDNRQALPTVFGGNLRRADQRTHNACKGDPLEQFLRWVELAESAGATDIHIEIRGNSAWVNVRVDGALEALDDGRIGRYSREVALDATAAGFNSARKGNSRPPYEADQFLDCVIGMNTARAGGQLRFQNLKGRLGPKVVIRLQRNDQQLAGVNA